MPIEAAAVPLPWTCRVVFTLDGLPPMDRVARGHTAADAAALARNVAESGAVRGVWISAYVLIPAHRIITIDLADPIEEKGK
jgi:hypothetical protein